MSSPLPPDPYVALGVSKDSDTAQIKSAHRKLVLKFHPDRIKGDDVDEKNRAKDEFQKVQQAYELLVDPSRRARYDDRIKLADLQRERMMMRESSRPTVQTPKATPSSTFVRKDGIHVEERAPTSYFDSRDSFDDPLPRSSSRKYEAPYEKERKSSAPKPAEKKEKFSSKLSPVDGISMKATFNLKAKAAQARDRVREQDSRAKSEEIRDREKRHARHEKHSGRRTAYVEEVESDSDSDTEVPSYSSRPVRPSGGPMQESESIRPRSPRTRRGAPDADDSHDEDENKWERHHKISMNYIAESQKRPSIVRNDSDAHVFWGGDYAGGRRSGSDTEKRPSSSRRTKPDEARVRPAMPGHSSSPADLKPYVEERAPPRSRTTGGSSEPSATQRAMPNLNRAHTMPVNKTAKKDTAPTRGSNLKHSETQDSGYYSSSNSRTPEMKGESPPPTRENSKKKVGNNSTRYTIVDSDDDRASRVNKILDSDDDRHRRTRSPESEKRDRPREREREPHRDRERDRDPHRDRERERGDRDRLRERERPIRSDSDSRSRPSRGTAPTSYPRGEFARHETSSPRGSPPVGRGKLFAEVSSDEQDMPHTYRTDAKHVKQAAYRPAATNGYGNPRFYEADYDHAPSATSKEHVRYAGSRRSSAVH